MIQLLSIADVENTETHVDSAAVDTQDTSPRQLNAFHEKG